MMINRLPGNNIRFAIVELRIPSDNSARINMHNDIDSSEAIADRIGDSGDPFGRRYIRSDEVLSIDRVLRPQARCGQNCGARFAKWAGTLSAARGESSGADHEDRP